MRNHIRQLQWVCTLIPGAAAAVAPAAPRQRESPDFLERLEQATTVLREMGAAPESITSVNYHVLYLGRREFATERQRVLEAVRRNFLGFMRRLKIHVDPKHGKLLVIILDDRGQMAAFHRNTSPDAPPLERWVAGFYSPTHNWSVFYNQRSGPNLVSSEASLNAMARRLVSMPGGPGTIVEVTTPRGRLRKTKRQVARDMKREWERITRAVNEFNTAVTQHEGAHQLAFNAGIQRRGARYPFWVSEGLACMFEVPPGDKRRGTMGAARTNGLRLATYRKVRERHDALRLTRLTAFKPGDTVQSVDALYAESWATFTFLFHRHANELSAYLEALAARPADATTDFDETAEFQRHFGEALDQLQAEFDDYIDRLK